MPAACAGFQKKCNFFRRLTDIISQVNIDAPQIHLGLRIPRSVAQAPSSPAPPISMLGRAVFALAKLFPRKRRRSQPCKNTLSTLRLGTGGNTDESRKCRIVFTCEIMSDNSSSCHRPGHNFASETRCERPRPSQSLLLKAGPSSRLDLH